MILLDTHALIWFVAGERLKRSAAHEIAQASQDRALAISSLTSWEIGTLVRKQRLDLGIPAANYLQQILARRDMMEIPVTVPIGLRAAALSPDLHGDPMDRILVSTAIEHNCPIVTRDRRILDFAKKSGAFSAIAC